MRKRVRCRDVAVQLAEDHELSSGRTARRGRRCVPLESYGKTIGMSHVLRTPKADSRRFFAEALPFGLS